MRRDTSKSLGLTPRLEDYLESISILSQEHGHAHVRDIAAARDVTMATVSEAVRSLADRDLIVHEGWGDVVLTKEGATQARDTVRRHDLLLKFFYELLGLPQGTAEHEACTAEHTMAGETLRRIRQLIECVDECRQIRGQGCGCMARFRRRSPATSTSITRGKENAAEEDGCTKGLHGSSDGETN